MTTQPAKITSATAPRRFYPTRWERRLFDGGAAGEARDLAERARVEERRVSMRQVVEAIYEDADERRDRGW